MNEALDESHMEVLKQIIPFILNVSHYMTDLSYLLYYINVNFANELIEIQQKIIGKILELRITFKRILELDFSMESIKFFKDLITVDLNVINDILTINDEMKRYLTDAKLDLQLDNCLIGFINLTNFIKKIPASSNEKVTMVFSDIIKNELLESWKFELNLLNCKIFKMICSNERIINLYKESNPEDDKINDFSKGDNFIKLINWLKDNQVFNQ
ncbi:hypothetical protein KAFR_0E01890 [Kazachstania africana CBS 2517]|uniref:Uncharacterized protein n=1 Tax=Kazachstania africana (strain ATCC 22294 / BCRC 22015 / CBS 2517 / CECT 1963 / NBRC 1671 / NRRL Y-8276) TaxID=1071382 RepID=H2AVE3_KAZAF|nr:hypothetical protein KAFR_0E01890 [Kazachstania africana CBS 2517]CCF58343.1 hypothetical protein KAFR_0E01890 [Kazachstania africana CBS 2517]